MSRPTVLLTGVLAFTAAAAVFSQTDGAQVAELAPGADAKILAEIVAELEKRVAALEERVGGQVASKSQRQALVPFESVVVNLKEENLTRYIRVSLLLGVDSDNKVAAEKAVTQLAPYLKDWLLDHLADKTISDLSDGKGQQELRQEIRAGINAQFSKHGQPEYLRQVLFDEYTIQ